MNGKYRVNNNSIEIENNQYTSYGIEYIVNGRIIDMIDNITLNKDDISYICEFLNRNRIPLVHFRDIIEDFMTK